MRVILVSLLLLPTLARADMPGTFCSAGKWGHQLCIRPGHFVFDTCHAISEQARRHGLDAGFFARLIWQESRFDPNARSHANAQGIAQFIPSTAAKRGLKDSYNPAQSLEHSAQYLGELQTRYGNPGLAAVAYNGGEARADGFLRQGPLANETINYVRIITGLSAETWRDAPPSGHSFALAPNQAFLPACYAMAKTRRLTPLPGAEPVIKPWGVQLAWGRSETQARKAYRRNVRACRAVASRERADFLPVKNRVRGRKGYVMARIGRNSGRAAHALCARFRRSGCACSVHRN